MFNHFSTSWLRRITSMIEAFETYTEKLIPYQLLIYCVFLHKVVWIVKKVQDKMGKYKIMVKQAVKPAQSVT